MKIMFAGPTLHGLVTAGGIIGHAGITCRAPAQGGDIARAVLDGASIVGLVDGRYEDVAAPWHKEILFALSRGVRVCGAASMGALRAAECAIFGMEPVGEIARRYLRGDLVDDAAVAQIHAPPEMGCIPLSEALVNVEATIASALDARSIDRQEAQALSTSASRLFFKDRTYAAIVEDATLASERRCAVGDALIASKRDVKREDALVLVDILAADDGSRPAQQPWSFHEPTAWRTFISAIAAGASKSHADTPQ